MLIVTSIIAAILTIIFVKLSLARMPTGGLKARSSRLDHDQSLSMKNKNRIPMKNFNTFMMLILLSPLMSMAQSPAPSDAGKTNTATRSFVVLDKNKDGHISREEAQLAGVSTLNFDAADKDKDGRLNLSEWTLVKF